MGFAGARVGTVVFVKNAWTRGDLRVIAHYGGTFDPVHNGHLAVASAVQQQLNVDVFFMPSADPPHRAATTASALQRAEMIQLAIAGNSRFHCDTRELQRVGKSYSVLSLRELRAEFGTDCALLWIIGVDSFIALDTWHNWRELFDLCHFVVVNRPGNELAQMNSELRLECESRWLKRPEELAETGFGGLYSLQMPMQAISSSEIRRGFSDGRTMNACLSESVYRYIKQHQLYTSRV